MDMQKTAEIWANNEANSEAEAFETAIKRLKPVHFQVDDKYEQAYRQGYTDGFNTCNKLIVGKLLQENAELRELLQEQSEQIQKLRECIARGSENEWD